MKKFFYTGISVVLATSIFTGCSYKVKPITTSAVNIYSSYDSKIKGEYYLILDDSLKDISRSISPSSYACSAHTYPIEMGDSLKLSIKKTIQNIFENITERSTLPTNEELKNTNAKGSILVKLDSLEPRVRCTPSFFSMPCTASTDMELGIIIRGNEGKLFATSVSDTAVIDGDAGSVCDKVADVLSESITKSTKKSLERMAERISNSHKLREYSNL